MHHLSEEGHAASISVTSHVALAKVILLELFPTR